MLSESGFQYMLIFAVCFEFIYNIIRRSKNLSLYHILKYSALGLHICYRVSTIDNVEYVAGPHMSYHLIRSIMLLCWLSFEACCIKMFFKMIKHSAEKRVSIALERFKILTIKGCYLCPLLYIFALLAPATTGYLLLYIGLGVILSSLGLWILYPRYIAPFLYHPQQLPNCNLKLQLKELTERLNFDLNHIRIEHNCTGFSVKYRALYGQQYIGISSGAFNLLKDQTLKALVCREVCKSKCGYKLNMYLLGVVYHIFEAAVFLYFLCPDQSYSRLGLIINLYIANVLFKPLDVIYDLIETKMMEKMDGYVYAYCQSFGYDLNVAMNEVNEVKEVEERKV